MVDISDLQHREKGLDIFDKVCYHKTEISPKNVYKAMQCTLTRALHHQKVRQRNRILGTLFHGYEIYVTSVLGDEVL